MRKIVFIAILCLISPLINAQAQEIFWDREKLPSTDIQDKDFKYQYGSSQSKSLGDMEVYDTESTNPLDDKPKTRVPVESEYVTPYQPDPLNPTPPAANQAITPPPVRTPAATTRPADNTDRPAPAVKKREIQQPSVSTKEQSQQAAPSGETAKPASKKMKWGQTEEAKPIENKVDSQDDGKPKYRWGQ